MIPTPTRRCQAFLERLSLFVDGDLTDASRRSVEAHLRQCPCCRQLADGLRQTVHLCREAGHRRLPPAVRARARARIAALLDREPPAAVVPGPGRRRRGERPRGA